jgi:AcrR family transcriptional regulator
LLAFDDPTLYAARPMPSPPDDAPRPRRSDPTRARILDAARRKFSRDGYDGTTIRAVATEARIDPSMVMRYYGSKDGLFAAAADVDLDLPDLEQIPRRQWGRRMARHFFERWERGPGESTLVLLLRSAATNEHAAERLRTIADAQIAHALERAGVDQAPRRAGLMASQMVGVAYCRYVLGVPVLAAAAPEDLVGDLGRTLQRYMTGALAGDE